MIKEFFMPFDIVVGAQWGDEGKAKIIDFLSRDASHIVRFQGGANAGHTVIVGENKYVFHLVPSGIIHPDKHCVIGSGVVLDPVELFTELDGIEARGIDPAGRLTICGTAHLIMPYHKVLDAFSESGLGEGKIGTTGKGIGPAYMMKASRRGLRCFDIVNGSYPKKIRANVAEANLLLTDLAGDHALEPMEPYFDGKKIDAQAVIKLCDEIRERLSSLVKDGALVIKEAVENGGYVLAEGAQGMGLDINFGTYPFVTSSNPIAGGACTGIGIGPSRVRDVYGIVKAYLTRVGAGPFPTELFDETGAELQKTGGEFGATTGRPRRCGWLDCVFGRYSAWINGLTKLIITKLDVLDELDEIKICYAYDDNGAEIRDFTGNTEKLSGYKPKYKTFEGWKTNTTGIRRYEDLPGEARIFLEYIESELGVPIDIISVGPDREETFRK